MQTLATRFNEKKITLGVPCWQLLLWLCADYDNKPPNTVSFMHAIASTSGRLHSEFERLLLLQAHRETDPRGRGDMESFHGR
jgi:hypothetical protein